MSTLLYIPTVSPEDLASFDQAHFSEAHHAHLSSQFLPPPPPAEVVIPDDDGLGYYPDGRKRTLTDEQIAIFRHSEIQELLRRRKRNTKRRLEHKSRKASRKTQEDALTAADAAVEARAKAAAEEKASHPENHPEVAPEVARQGRLEAAIWASALGYDENLTGNKGKEVAPAVMAPPPGVLKVVPQVGAGGKEFLWPAIEGA